MTDPGPAEVQAALDAYYDVEGEGFLDDGRMCAALVAARKHDPVRQALDSLNDEDWQAVRTTIMGLVHESTWRKFDALHATMENKQDA